MEDEEFNEVTKNSSTLDPFTLKIGFLFKNNKFFIPKSPLRDFIMKAHEGSLISHIDINKKILKQYFY